MDGSRDAARDAVEDVLTHFGVKGMKWGVRKGKSAPTVNPKQTLVLEKTLKTGDKISIYQHPPSALGKLIARVSGGDPSDFKAFALRDKDGKKVGDASIRRKSKDELYLNWIGIRTKHRGKGYASAALQGVVKYAQSEGIKKLTLDVPGNAPDARHIYEKLGFKDDGKMTGTKNDIWGGLYPMSMDVDQVKHAVEDLAQWEEDFVDEFAAFLIENFGTQGGSMEQSTTVEDFLAHYGVKGMKWGRRKAQLPTSDDAARLADIKTKAKTGKTKALSNAELQAAINRMQLEQNFKRLSVNEKSPVTRFISSTLLEIGKREVQATVAKKVAGAVAKKVATGGVG